MRHRTRSTRETQSLAKKLAKRTLKKEATKKAIVIGLVGELGSGKTTFVKSFMRELGVKRRITSPTFLIVRRFGIKHKRLKNVFHVDAYRVKNKQDLSGIDFREILKEKSNIVLVEWADRILGVLPKGTIWVKFKYGKNRNEREITFD